MAQSSFFSTGVHRHAVISTSPEHVRIKYNDTLPPPNTSTKGTILLVHGWPQTSYQFRHVIPLFAAAGYRTIVPDYRGSGDSSRPMSLRGYLKSTLATDLHTLITSPDHLDIKDPVHIVGHDIGGMIAHSYATLFPSDTASITWGECPLPGTSFYDRIKSSEQVFHFTFHRILDLPEQLIRGNEFHYLKHFYDKLSYNAAAITPADLQYYVAQYSQPGAMRASINVYRMFEEDAKENRGRRDRDGKCRVRCLTLNGDRSFLKEDAADEAGEFYESFETAEIEDAMHYIAEENPEGFVREVVRFVEGR